MATILRFTIEVEQCDNSDFDITTEEADELLAALENECSKLGYSIYDQRWEADTV